jgi:hypothetical protein
MPPATDARGRSAPIIRRRQLAMLFAKDFFGF